MPICGKMVIETGVDLLFQLPKRGSYAYLYV
jgi:hypothetical protein